MHILSAQTIFKKFGGRKSFFLEATDTSVFDLWWRLPWDSNLGWIPSRASFVACAQRIPQTQAIFSLSISFSVNGSLDFTRVIFFH